MKKALLLFIALVGLNSASFAKGSKVKTLTIEISFKGVEEGYDHLTKSEIYINGDYIGSTVEHKETRKISKTIEEHTIDNNYSIDCIIDETLKLGKKKKIVITFDLDNGSTFKLQ